MQIFGVFCRPGEPAVKVGHEILNPLIGLCNRADILQTHLFNQAILECFIYPFHATFGLAAIGANQFDSQFPESPSELGRAGTSTFLPIDSDLQDGHGGKMQTLLRHLSDTGVQDVVPDER